MVELTDIERKNTNSCFSWFCVIIVLAVMILVSIVLPALELRRFQQLKKSHSELTRMVGGNRMPSEKGKGAEDNRARTNEAMAYLMELINDALISNGRAKAVHLRIPLKGRILGDPVGWVEKRQ